MINGPNCLGIRSQPGHYDSLFIPRPKLSALATASSVGKSRPGSDAAFISQSGALLAAKLSRLPDLDFRYCISVGNQIDLTLGDFLTFLQDDPSVRLFVVYAEGFQPLDGLRFLEAAARIRRRHGTVLLYRAGRSQAGAHAAASHTATLVGDYTVAAALARSADVVLADSLEDFEDLISMFASLQRPRGKRLAVVTNAGFESVAASDNLGGLELATFSDPTKARLHSILIREQLIGVVDVTNPLDLTPMAGDEAFEEAVRIVLEDENVDLGVVGCVPLTPALNTLAAGRGHREDVHGTDSIARRLVRLKGNLDKPWITTIDSGTAYDPLKRLLEKEGIPTFAAIDRAVRLLSTFARHTTASVEG